MNKKILVHVCCAPDAAFPLQLLSFGYNPTAYFYNPCIHPEKEYYKRLSEMEKVKKYSGIPYLEGEYNVKKWFEAIKGLEDEQEGGKRCYACIKMRLEETAMYARENGYPYFTTVLTASSRKDFKKVCLAGQEAQKITGVTFLPVNFKKHGWFEKTLELSKSLGLYRQNYCGCRFSFRGKKSTKAGKIESKKTG